MVVSSCKHECTKKDGRDRYGHQRLKCCLCGKRWSVINPKPLGDMRIDLDEAKHALRLLVEGMSIRATERITRLHRDTLCKLIVHFGNACQRFMDGQMRGLKLSHLEFDEQWTWVGRKQARLTVNEKAERYYVGDVYIWTCIDKTTKLMPSFMLGKRSADNARRFMMDVAGRLVFPNPHASDAHKFAIGEYPIVCQLSTDGFAGYPEAVDLAFGPYVRYGTIIKEYKNANMIYTPSEMVGTIRTGKRNIGPRQERSITTSHVERLHGTQRTFMKRLNRLTLCFSKKLENLEAAFAMFACYYNYCWRTRKPGKSGQKRPTACMMAGITDHLWSFDELFSTVLNSAPA
jgi:transposase-like protein/IS1 family transposase